MVELLRLLSIGGNDPTGGAGIQADIKTFAAHRAYGLAILTTLIAGDTTHLRAVQSLPAEFVAAQLEPILSDIAPHGIKTGLLGEAAVIETVADRLVGWRAGPLVIDPVLVAKSGSRIVDDAACRATIRRLLPLATLTTPNIREASALSGRSITNVAEMGEAARAIAQLGAQTVIVKGRDLASTDGQVWDVFYDGRQVIERPLPRLATRNIRGSGCTLSAALLALLAAGRPAAEAFIMARDWVVGLLAASAELRIGHGTGPLNHQAVPVPGTG
jgi:hydroxymethylpyrimidine/phosphomethylpyrimidine kinase